MYFLGPHPLSHAEAGLAPPQLHPVWFRVIDALIPVMSVNKPQSPPLFCGACPAAQGCPWPTDTFTRGSKPCRNPPFRREPPEQPHEVLGAIELNPLPQFPLQSPAPKLPRLPFVRLLPSLQLLSELNKRPPLPHSLISAVHPQVCGEASHCASVVLELNESVKLTTLKTSNIRDIESPVTTNICGWTRVSITFLYTSNIGKRESTRYLLKVSRYDTKKHHNWNGEVYVARSTVMD